MAGKTGAKELNNGSQAPGSNFAEVEFLSLDLIDSNPYNSRLGPMDTGETDMMARSIEQLGLISPILVRPKFGGRFELVFGHRRLEAARWLGWEKIRAEVKSVSDEEMIKLSAAENVAREDLSDYEKGICFSRMKRDFGITLARIGELVGSSESHVCNYIRMAELFDASAVEANPELLSDLRLITEHHARILLRIPDLTDRRRMLRLVVSEKMSVRDIQRMLQRFKSWFPNTDNDHPKYASSQKRSAEIESSLSPIPDESEQALKGNEDDLAEINNVVLSEFRLPRDGDFASFANHHSFEHGYSIFASNPPLTRFDDNLAVEQERGWFFGDAIRMSAKIRDMRIQLYDCFSVVTLFVDHKGETSSMPTLEKSIRGTLVLSRTELGWKIVHEHWSNQESLPSASAMVGAMPGQR